MELREDAAQGIEVRRRAHTEDTERVIEEYYGALALRHVRKGAVQVFLDPRTVHQANGRQLLKKCRSYLEARILS